MLLQQIIEKYVNLTEADWLYFNSLLKFMTVKKKEYIFKKGDISNRLYLLKSGILRSYYIDKSNVEYTWQIHFCDDDARLENIFIADHMSLNLGEPSRFSLVAVEDSEVYYICSDDLQKFYNNAKNGEYFGCKITEALFSTLHNRVINKMTMNIQERYKYLNKYYPYIIKKLPQYHIATYLGTYPESLCRSKKRDH
jgi:CRP-like cAMP-binding protein